MNSSLQTVLYMGILGAAMLTEFELQEPRKDKPKSIHKKRSHKSMNRNKRRSRMK